jgi:HEAT repeat protein
VDAALKDVAAYEFGKGRESLTVVSEAVRDSQNSAEARKELVGKLLEVLKSDATLGGKQFVCQQLSIAGGVECVPVLAGMLDAADTSDMARYALERIPGTEADKALTDALDATEGLVKLGVVNSLGVRRCSAASPKLGQLAKDADKKLAAASLASLGKIGDDGAVKALEGIMDLDPALHCAWADAYLLCADKLAMKSADKACKMYEKLQGASEPENIQVAAFCGHVNALGAAAAPTLAEALSGENLGVRQAAAKLIRTVCVGDAAATDAFVDVFGKLDPAGQALVISSLADRGDKAALPKVMESSKSADDAVRLAAFAALGKLGGAESVTLLSNAAASAKGAEREIARASLASLHGDNVDSVIVKELKSASAEVKTELARGLAARNALSAVPALIELTRDENEQVRGEVYVALGVLAEAKDIPAILDSLVVEAADAPRKEGVNAVVTIAKRIPEENKRAEAVLARLDVVKEAPALSALYAVLGQVGDVNGLKPLVDAVKNDNGEIKEAAVRALSGWPTTAATDDLATLASDAKDDTERALLMRGLLRLLELPSDISADAKLGYYEKVVKIANSVDEKKLVIGSLATVKDLRALALVDGYLGVDELKQEAALAADRVKASAYKVTASSNGDKAGDIVDGKLETRWLSGTPQKPDMFITIDLGAKYLVSKLTLDASPTPSDYPRGYKVFVADNADDMGEPVAEGAGAGPVTEITFTPKAGKFIKIVQTGSDEKAMWTIHELKIESQSEAKAGN